jgi:hypothetical protein
VYGPTPKMLIPQRPFTPLTLLPTPPPAKFPIHPSTPLPSTVCFALAAASFASSSARLRSEKRPWEIDCWTE